MKIFWTNVNVRLIFIGLEESGIKFVYSEKATKFCEISTLLLTDTTKDKSKVEISQKILVFSEYMNFNVLSSVSSTKEIIL